MSVAIGGALSLLALISFGKAAATPARGLAIPVDFDAPPGCSDVDAFRRGVAARLSRSTGAAEVASGTRLSVRVVRLGTRVQGDLRLINGHGATDTRRVEGTTCDQVVAVLALTAALALEPAVPPPALPAADASPAPARPLIPVPPAAPPRLPLPVPPPPGQGAPSAPAPPAGVPMPPALRASADPGHNATTPRAGWLFEVGAGAALARVVTPGLNLGGALMLGVTRRVDSAVAPSLRLALLYLRSDFLLPAGDVVATWTSLALGACPGWGVARGVLQGQICARGVAGWLAATDGAVSNPRAAGRSWWAAGAFMRGAAAVGAGFSVEIEAGLDAVLVQRRFITTTPLRTVADTPPVSLLVGVGLSRRL